MYLKIHSWDFPGGPVVKNLPSSSEDVSLIPGWGTKIPRCLMAIKPMLHAREGHMPQQRPSAAREKKKKNPACIPFFLKSFFSC